MHCVKMVLQTSPRMGMLNQSFTLMMPFLELKQSVFNATNNSLLTKCCPAFFLANSGK